MSRILKKILILLLILIVLGSISFVYLNNVFLPTKIHALIIKNIEERTGKKASLEKVQFNIFKGLVLRNLAINDAAGTVLSAKEINCSFLIWPFFRKQIIIPGLRVRQALLNLERSPGNKLNIIELFSAEKTGGGQAEPGYNLLVKKISVVQSRVSFKDKALSPEFSGAIDNIDFSANLLLPATVKFDFSGEIPGKNSAMRISSDGQYRIAQKQLAAEIKLKNVNPSAFSVYCRQLGVAFTQGLIDAEFDVGLKDSLLGIDLNAQAKQIGLSKDQFTCLINGRIQANFRYDLKAKRSSHSGNIDFLNSSISGLQYIDTANNICGKLDFSNYGLSSEKLNAEIFGMPCQVKLKLADFALPAVDAQIQADLSLGALQSVSSDKFKFSLPGQLQGNARLSLELRKDPSLDKPQISGNIQVSQASLKLENLLSAFDSINGKAEFSYKEAQPDGSGHAAGEFVKWQDLQFSYSGADYKTSGSLTGFKAPLVRMELGSPEFFLQGEFGIKDKSADIRQLKLKSSNSGLALKGSLDFSSADKLRADISGSGSVDLEDLSSFLKEHRERFKEIKPQGSVSTSFNLSGDLRDFKSCLINAHLSSPAISAYGLSAQTATMEYSQAKGIIDITLLRFILYGGALELESKINLNSAGLPFLANLNIQNIKLEKLKLDTPMKNQDIAGNIQAQAKLGGFLSDWAKLSGRGAIVISGGRLWQLNLLKGIGKMLFTQDFTNVVFNEGSCNFVVADENISTNDLQLKSNLVNLNGEARIGFNGSVVALIKAQVLQDVPLTGSLKDVTTTILGQAEKFGAIKINGTLKDPKFTFQAAVGDIINTIKDIFWKK